MMEAHSTPGSETDQVFAQALEAKAAGNKMFGSKDFASALEQYTNALELIGEGDCTQEQQKLRTDALNNRAATYLQLLTSNCTEMNGVEGLNAVRGVHVNIAADLTHMYSAQTDLKALLHNDSQNQKALARMVKVKAFLMDALARSVNEHEPSVVAELLDRGTSPDVMIPSAFLEGGAVRIESNKLGQIVKDSALAVAAHYLQNDVVKLLLDSKADTELSGEATGFTALLHAAKMGNKEGIRLLLSRGASLAAAERQYNFTAFHLACIRSQDQCVQELIEHAACDITAIDSDGKTGEELAQERGYGGVLSMLAMKRFRAAHGTSPPKWLTWNEPAYTTTQTKTIDLRFVKGQRVECWMAGSEVASAGGYPYVAGMVAQCWYREDNWKSKYWAAYQVLLDECGEIPSDYSGGLIFVALDDYAMIRGVPGAERIVMDPRHSQPEPTTEPSAGEPLNCGNCGHCAECMQGFMKFCADAREDRAKTIRHSQCRVCRKVDTKACGITGDPGIIPPDPNDFEFAALQ